MILIFLTLGSWLSLQNSNAKSIQCNVSGNSYGNTQIEFTFPGFYLDTVVINGESYSRVNMPGVVDYLKKGYPQLPRVAKSVIIPDNMEMKLRIIKEDFERVKVPPVMPSKGNILRNVSPSSVPYTFSDFYTSDDIFPAEVVTISNPFIIKDFRGITVYVNPIRYDAGTGELIILNKLIIEIYSEGISLSNVKSRLVKRVISPSVKNLYRDFFVNFSESNLRYDMLEEDAGRMIIISADQYLSEMDSFLVWKRKKGIPTDLYSLSTVGSDTASVRNFIQNQYDSLGVAFCLLVGDGDELPPYKGTVGLALGKDADHVYTYTDGDDKYPDLFIGRFSSNGGDVNNIRNQVMRSIEYERNPEEGTDWYSRGLMVASDLSDDDDTIMDKQRCEWLKDTLLYDISPYFTYTSIDSSYDPWGTSSIIFNSINAGVSNINYIGHGNASGWGSGGGFYRSNIAALTNYTMLPHVITVGCQVGNFNGRTCFSEDALTAGTPESPTGFIVTLAPTIDQTWIPPCVGQEGAVNLLAHYEASTAGSIYFNGCCYMIEQYGGDTSELGVEIAQTWHIFGDPSIELRTNIPKKFKVNKPDVIYPDSLVYEIIIFEEDSVTPVDNALIAFYGEVNSLIESAYTNSSGVYTLTINSENIFFDEYIYLTVSKFNYEPYMYTIPILGVDFSPDSVEVNVPTEVEITARSGLEVRVDGYGFKACDTTDNLGKVFININAALGEELQVSFTDTALSRLMYRRALPVYGALDLPSPNIKASCDTIQLSDGLMPGISGNVEGSTGLSSFFMFLEGPGFDTSLFTSENLLEHDLMMGEVGELRVVLGKSGYNIFQSIISVKNYMGWLSGYIISGSDSINEINLQIYNAGSDTTIISPIASLTSDINGFYELEDSLLCGFYDIYSVGVGYQYGKNEIIIRNSDNIFDFNIAPEQYALNVPKLINKNVLDVNYSLPFQTDVEFLVYDATGRNITSDLETNNAGWFTTNISLSNVSSGVYFLVVKAGERIFPPEKFVLIK